MDGLALVGMILLTAGFILVGIEVVLPGFSVPGISGIICLVAGVFLLADSVMEAAFITIAVLALLGILMAVLLWMLSKGKLKTPIILEEEQHRAEGYLSSNDLKYLLGRRGFAVTDLRPSGVGKIDEINFDVMSEGNYISGGAEIEIIKVEGSKLVVRELKEGGKKNG
ncbi:MAG: NfeD family protein [Lachnospiraceae bacterium]|nr:NfeD family protein [Lachnospiraceae bacterium]